MDLPQQAAKHDSIGMGKLGMTLQCLVFVQVLNSLLREGAAPQELWRQPLLSWALPCAACALVSCWPPASPQLWHQASVV